MSTWPVGSKYFLGNTQITYAQVAHTPVWSAENRGVTPIAVPTALFTALGRAYDPYAVDTLRTSIDNTSGPVAQIGDFVGTWGSIAANNLSSSGAILSTVTQRLSANAAAGETSRPQLVEWAGRKCLKFDGVNDHLSRTVSPMDQRVFNAFTMGAMVYTTATTVGIPLAAQRAEYASSRSSIDGRFELNTPKNDFRARAKLDDETVGGVYGSTSPGCWKLMWLEWDFNTGDGSQGNLFGEFGGVEIDQDFTVSYGADSPDTVLNRIYLGARLNGSSVTDFFNSYIGRIFWISRKFDSGERATLKQWLRGTKFVP